MKVIRCDSCRCLTSVEDDRPEGPVFCGICRQTGGRSTYPEGVITRMAKTGDGRSDWEARLDALIPFDVPRGYGDLR